jgi:hypothetical protein
MTKLNENEKMIIACRIFRETKLADSRTVWDLLTDDRSRKAVEIAEAYTRGEATGEELMGARKAATAAAAEARVAEEAASRAATAAAAWLSAAHLAWRAARARAEAAEAAARVATMAAAAAEMVADLVAEALWTAAGAAAWEEHQEGEELWLYLRKQQVDIICEVVTYEEVISLVSMLTDGGE